jgi:hypothetical protein
MHWMNTVVNYCGPFEYEVGYCEKLKNFLEANLEWMQREMELNPDSPYWHQVGQATLLSGGKVALLSVLVSCAVSPWLALSEPETQPNLVSVSICTPPPQAIILPSVRLTDLQLPILAQMPSPAFLLSENLAKWRHVALTVRKATEGWTRASTISEEGRER